MLGETGLKQSELADKLGVSQNYISMLLNGQRVNISSGLARLMEALFGFDADWILTGNGEPRRTESAASRRDIEREIERDMERMDNVEVGDLAYLAEKIMKERRK
jgi:transcriptional regulator with XRE-family HTH domain